MSRTDTWMPLYIGDYLADTRRLSTTEHGAYLLLLMEQWRRGWVPEDEHQLSRITGLRLDHWRRLSGTILCFFATGDIPGTLRNARLHAEREKARQVADKRAEIARDRWQKNAQDSAGDFVANSLKSHVAPDANALHEQCKSIHNNNHNHREDIIVEAKASTHPKPRKRVSGAGPDFDIFWTLYPRKVGKGAAERAWPRAVADAGGADEIVFALRQQIDNRHPTVAPKSGPEFVPHASTYLNGKRWLDGARQEQHAA